MGVSESQIRLMQNLFRGRQDVFAVRWQKGEKSGYMPAYDIDWTDYERHKASGGTFKTYKRKQPKPISERDVHDHLTSKTTIGIYPLLQDNTSCFIAADFDKEGWLQNCRSVLQVCSELQVPAYLERSRSGIGGHIWIFFREPYPAIRSRKIFFSILRAASILSEYEKEDSFDRLFPSQDFLSGKGFGNLIALPLQGEALRNGNSCFVDPESADPVPDQWRFLERVQKLGNRELDLLYKHLVDADAQSVRTLPPENGKFLIRQSAQIELQKHQIPSSVVAWIRNELNLPNPEYQIKKRTGRSIYGVLRYFKLYKETEERIFLPRGVFDQLITFCSGKEIGFELQDDRPQFQPVQFKTSIQLRPYQEPAIEAAQKKEQGVIVSPPGSGKTVMALEIIARKALPALIIVHRRQLLDQWIERIESFLGIPRREIGRFDSQKKQSGKMVTIGMIQTLVRLPDFTEIDNAFGTILIDECHHIPADSFRKVIRQLNSRFMYGLTATPIRKNKDEKLIFSYIGESIARIDPDEHAIFSPLKTLIHIRETQLSVPFDRKTDHYETLSNILVFYTGRNEQIIKDILAETNAGKKALVLTERVTHVDVLGMYLKGSAEVITISGADSERTRKSRIAQIKAGDFQVVISTGQYFGEGIDIEGFDCLFLVYPFSFKGKLIQYIGRIQRGESKGTIYDYRDKQIAYFEKMFKKREQHYRKLN